MEAKQKTRLKKFLKDNKITFKGEGSALNSDCVVFAGFGLYVTSDDISCVDDLCTIISSLPGHNKDFETEFRRVFDYAYTNNYFSWWDSPQAKAKYTF